MPKLRASARPKAPHAASNARASRKIIVRHAGGGRALLRAPLDMRSAVGKAYRARLGELITHLGGAQSVSTAQRVLADRAVRLGLLVELAWAELWRTGAFRKGNVAPAFDALRKAIADECATLKLLGLERRAQEVPTLEDYLSRRQEAHAANPKTGTA